MSGHALRGSGPVDRIIAMFWSIIFFFVAFFQSMIQPLVYDTGSVEYRRGGSGSGGGGGGSGNGGGRGGPNRRFGTLNTNTMDMSSCPASGGCCR